MNTTYTYDDGSTLVYDGDVVVSGTDSSGASINVGAGGNSPMMQQVMQLLNYGVRAAVDARYPPRPTPIQQQQAAAAQTQNFGGLLLLAAGAFVLWKALA